MPGEERDLTARVPSDMFSRSDSKGKPEWKVKIKGWNVEPVTLAPHATTAVKSEPAL
jgi:hypothetical protein